MLRDGVCYSIVLGELNRPLLPYRLSIIYLPVPAVESEPGWWQEGRGSSIRRQGQEAPSHAVWPPVSSHQPHDMVRTQGKQPRHR